MVSTIILTFLYYGILSNNSSSFCLEVNNACKQEQLVHTQYGNVVEGMRTYVNAIADQKQGFFSQKRNFIAGMKHLDDLAKGKGEFLDLGFMKRFPSE